MTQVFAPFNDEQVKSINAFQQSRFVHHFTCPRCGSDLKATATGINCYVCGKWFQNWCHDFMADYSWTRYQSNYIYSPYEADVDEP